MRFLGVCEERRRENERVRLSGEFVLVHGAYFWGEIVGRFAHVGMKVVSVVLSAYFFV